MLLHVLISYTTNSFLNFAHRFVSICYIFGNAKSSSDFNFVGFNGLSSSCRKARLSLGLWLICFEVRYTFFYFRGGRLFYLTAILCFVVACHFGEVFNYDISANHVVFIVSS